MKKYKFFVLFIAIFPNIEAQIVFCPSGAEWHNTFYYPMTNESRNEQTKYVKDSIVDGETVKVLLHNNYYNECNYTVTIHTLNQAKR